MRLSPGEGERKNGRQRKGGKRIVLENREIATYLVIIFYIKIFPDFKVHSMLESELERNHYPF